ncbi:MAG: PEGA domain-containing protein [Melioribacteraceae bacterium]
MKLLHKIILLLLVLSINNSCVDEHIIDMGENTNGSILVRSHPDSAKIFLLGTNIQKYTPDSLLNLESGVYDVSLRHEDYIDTNFTVEVFRNKKTTKYITLRLQEFHGKIILKTIPVSAAIFLNDISTSKFTPDSLTSLRDGVYRIKLSIPNYNDTTLTVQLGKDSTLLKTIQLSKDEPKGEIVLTSNPTNCKIYYDNSFLNSITPDTLRNLIAGNYSVKLSYPGYYDSTFTIHVGKDQKINKFIKLREVPPNGNLFIQSDPIGAKIFLQGISANRITPDTLKQLPVGPYLVTLSLEDFRDTSFIAKVERNILSAFSVGLEDTTSDVKTDIKYTFNNDGEILFSFFFNQDVQIETIEFIPPNSISSHTISFNNQHYLEGTPVEYIYTERKVGIWKFKIVGGKLTGRKDEFGISKITLVQ